VDALLHELPAPDDLWIGPPLFFIAGSATDAIAATDEDGLAYAALVEPVTSFLDSWVVAMVKATLEHNLRPLDRL
jgi:hypothetical protein